MVFKGEIAMPTKVKVSDLVKEFNMEIICGEGGMKRRILVTDLYRPGLEMAGYFAHHPKERVQILGKTELTFFDQLPTHQRIDRMERLCADETPCICISRGMEVPPELITAATAKAVPVLRSANTTTTLASIITGFLENKLAPSTTIHGVLVDVYGVGMLITGGSGIGKSETALELVKR